VALSLGAVGLIIWLSAAAAGPESYATVQRAIASWAGRIALFGCTFAFFLHLCGGTRHLVWDAVHGFELRSIYISGWSVMAACTVLTVAAWANGRYVGGWR
jgi:succinate dehydrogenase / fumarate reductase cytochrome b subunit